MRCPPIQTNQPTSAPALRGSVRSVVISTREWTGEPDERLDFPDDWDIQVMQMKGYRSPVLAAAVPPGST